MDTGQVTEALRKTGAKLGLEDLAERIKIFVAGGTAGMLGGLLNASRTTADCDVMAISPEESWAKVELAAKEVAKEANLPPTWLNRKSEMFAWQLPPGWQKRCELFARFGQLDVYFLCRKDFIAGKVVSATRRQFDFDDLLQSKPTLKELAFSEDNVSRIEAEDLGQSVSCDDCRTIIAALREKL